MQDFFSECDIPITVERALTYLVIWHYKGTTYKVPTNGVIYSPGTRTGEDKENFGSLGDTETWFIRPTSGLLKRSNIFNRGGRTRRTPLTKLYTAVRAEDFNLNLSAIRGRPVIPWDYYIKSYFSWGEREFATPSPQETATFILLVARILCDFYIKSGKNFTGAFVYQPRSLLSSRK
jgi:hypothetical protein